jgi:hypothetical protein
VQIFAPLVSDAAPSSTHPLAAVTLAIRQSRTAVRNQKLPNLCVLVFSTSTHDGQGPADANRRHPASCSAREAASQRWEAIRPAYSVSARGGRQCPPECGSSACRRCPRETVLAAMRDFLDIKSARGLANGVRPASIVTRSSTGQHPREIVTGSPGSRAPRSPAVLRQLTLRARLRCGQAGSIARRAQRWWVNQGDS